MKRRDFVRTSGIFTVGSFILPSILLEACKKKEQSINHTMSTIFSQTKIIDGTYSNVLTIPETLTLQSSPTLTAQPTSAFLNSSIKTSVYGYSNNILGPTIEGNSGETAMINFSNQLQEETNIHWHGLVIQQDQDGHPDNIIQPKNNKHYHFKINQRAGFYWYHPHPMNKTAKQVTLGLAGLFVVRDQEEEALNLPKGKFEIPLVIQDKRIHNNEIEYSPNQDDIMNGYFGNTIMVNGITFPYKEVEANWYRLRILNGSTARIYNLKFSNSSEFYIIGNDGGLLPFIEKVKNILLSPGERIDILIDFSSLSLNETVYLESDIFDGASIQGAQKFDFLKFICTSKGTEAFQLPQNLSSITPIQTTNETKVRSWVLGGMNMDHEHSLHSSDTNAGSMTMKHTINGKTYNSAEILATVKSGDTEIWEIDNSLNSEIHPMHIHGVQFQVLERIGGRNALFANEKGWKDTILLMPFEKVRIVLTFSSNLGKYLIHCHNLEHEDDGMMVNFEII